MKSPQSAPIRAPIRAPLASTLCKLFNGHEAQHRWRVLLLLLIAAISFLALSPHPPTGLSTGWDKSNHALAFGSLGFCGFWCVATRRERWALLPLALLVFGGVIELLQLQVPGRSGEWPDLLADSVGIALGMLIAIGLQRILKLR